GTPPGIWRGRRPPRLIRVLLFPFVAAGHRVSGKTHGPDGEPRVNQNSADPDPRRRYDDERDLTRSAIDEPGRTEGERSVAHGGYRTRHAAALRPSQRSGPARAEVWMWPGAVRRLHGDHQRRGGPF